MVIFYRKLVHYILLLTVVITINFWWNLDNTILLDSYENIFVSESNFESIEQENNFTYYEKCKRWVYWKTFKSCPDNNIHSYKQFKSQWDPSRYSIRSELKSQLNQFKNNPRNYLRKEREYYQMRGNQNINSLTNAYLKRRGVK